MCYESKWGIQKQLVASITQAFFPKKFQVQWEMGGDILGKLRETWGKIQETPYPRWPLVPFRQK